MPNEPTPVSQSIALGSRGLEMRSLEDVYRFAKYIAASPFVPKGFSTPESIVVAIQYGAEIGLGAMASLQNICVINGKPSIFGDAMLGLVRGSGLLEFIEETYEGEGQSLAARCVVKRRGAAAPRQEVFTVEMARRAGLWGKDGPWKTNPERMLRFRARAFALRDEFGDVLKGISMAEEAQDIPDHSRDIEGTTANDLNARLKGLVDSTDRPTVEENAPPKLSEVLGKIAAATTTTEMEQIRPLAKALPEADLNAARDAYTARMKTLNEPPQD